MTTNLLALDPRLSEILHLLEGDFSVEFLNDEIRARYQGTLEGESVTFVVLDAEGELLGWGPTVTDAVISAVSRGCYDLDRRHDEALAAIRRFCGARRALEELL